MKILRQKFPYNGELNSRAKVSAGYGTFIMLFLFVFKPFGLDEIPLGKMAFVAAIYGFITFACILVCSVGFARLFPQYFKEENWTTGRHIFVTMLTVLIVGIVNYSLTPFFLNTSYRIYNMLWFQGITVTLALLPVTIYILLAQNHLLKKFEQQAAQLELKLQEKLGNAIPEQESANVHFELTGENQREQLTLSLDEFYYIQAANNYIKIYFRKKDILVYTIVRMTMKKAEETLQQWHGLFRCHRAYIVNLDKVQHVEGNAQGYKLILQDAEEEIPVSRSLNNELSDRLLAVRK